MAAEETILDAPVTPAPVFAYRALRGMFFGSPDTPGIHTSRNLSSEYNKENDIPQLSKPTQALETAASWTPQKRKRGGGGNSMVSPTKSCLRTPGAATPRRELLRDINVTFMDTSIRSISPEVVPKNSQGTQREGDHIATKNKHVPERLRAQKSAVTKSRPPVKPVRNVPLIAAPSQESISPNQPLSTEQIVTSPDFDVQTYMSTTEKEMKKLIRYSQKMREYARKQDEENTKLKQLVEQLQKENTRLKRKVDLTDPEAVDLHDMDAQPDQKRRKTYGSIASRPHELDRVDSTRPPLGSLRGTQLNSLNSRNFLVSDTFNTQKPQIANQNFSISRPDQPVQPLRTSTNSNLNIPLRISPRVASNATNANLAPDRLAAARARIRQRSEMRKASTVPVPPEIRSDQGQIQYRSSPHMTRDAKGLKNNHTKLAGGTGWSRNDHDHDKVKDRDKDKESSMLDWADL